MPLFARFTTLAAFALLPLAAQAALVTLNPGLPTTDLGAGTTLAQDNSLAGTVIEDQVSNFTGPSFDGSYQARVVRRADTGTLDFYYRITAFTDTVDTRVLRDFRIAGFAGWDTAVSWRPDGLPAPAAGEAPRVAIRFPTPPCPACDGINFSFSDLGIGTPSEFTNGDESFFMLIRTNATAYGTEVADVYLVSEPGLPFEQTLSNPFTVFAPAIPEPQTYALLLLGLGAMAVALRRRRQ